MKLKTVSALVAGAVLCVGGASVVSYWVEERSHEVVQAALDAGGHAWTQVETDGLRVSLEGTAPDEATRFRAVTTVGRVIDPGRIIDLMTVRASAQVTAPTFSIEMLRNDSGVSLIGLVPATTDRETLVADIARLPDAGEVTDMLETANYPVPEGWDMSLDYAMNALQRLPRSKISVHAGEVEITAITDSPTDKSRVETELSRRAPSDLKLAMNISAPRPVITPFTLRFKLADGVATFDACSAHTEAGQVRIVKAATALGLQGGTDCAIGLGVPSPKWADAVETSMIALAELGGGTLTISDADIALVAFETTPQALFDRVVGEVEANLPEVFSLKAVLPEKVAQTDAEDVIEFVATRDTEGQVQLRGRLADDAAKKIIGSYARAQFGSGEVYLATRSDPDLPRNWSVRVLAALEALGALENGSVMVRPGYMEVRGATGSQTADDEISRLLSSKLGGTEEFELDVRYDELLDKTLNIPTPEECVKKINQTLLANKITFEPSSADITSAAKETIDKVAELVTLCRRARMEIGGHTDSQGREVMNQELSQERANAVLAALLERRVRIGHLTARGYGEALPVADNKTAAGREINRRIEFKLLADPQTADAGKDALEDDATDEVKETE